MIQVKGFYYLLALKVCEVIISDGYVARNAENQLKNFKIILVNWKIPWINSVNLKKDQGIKAYADVLFSVIKFQSSTQWAGTCSCRGRSDS